MKSANLSDSDSSTTASLSPNSVSKKSAHLASWERPPSSMDVKTSTRRWSETRTNQPTSPKPMISVTNSSDPSSTSTASASSTATARSRKTSSLPQETNHPTRLQKKCKQKVHSLENNPNRDGFFLTSPALCQLLPLADNNSTNSNILVRLFRRCQWRSYCQRSSLGKESGNSSVLFLKLVKLKNFLPRFFIDHKRHLRAYYFFSSFFLPSRIDRSC